MRKFHSPTTAPANRPAARQAAIALALAGGLLACAALLLAAARPAAAAPASTSRNYPDVAPCDTSLQACIDGSSDGDSIVITAGTYITSFTLDQAVSLIGQPGGGVILQALPGQRVGTITGTVISNSVVISGLTFTGGNLAGTDCPQDCGGGLLFDNLAQPLLVNDTFTNNSAYEGGGLYANIGSLVRLAASQFLSNSAVLYGGGAFAQSAVIMTGGVWQGNQCTDVNCTGGGLLAFDTLDMTDTQFLSNSAVSGGGGVSAFNTATLNGGLFQGNQCTDAFCIGGGMGSGSDLSLTGTHFISNSAGGTAGGLDVSGAAVLTGGLFQGNQCTDVNCTAGGLDAGFTLALTGTQFINNSAHQSGGGARMGGNAVLIDGLFQDNQCLEAACFGGGMATFGRQTALTGTRFINNSALATGGGMYAKGGGHSTNSLTISGVQFISNGASGLGGGLAVSNVTTSTIANSLFAANTSLSGTALNLDTAGHVALVYNTIASPTVGGGSAIYVTTGTVSITDTLIASYTVGLARVNGSVHEDYNLFSGLGKAISGSVVSGGHSLTGTAALANPAAANYHLTAVSDAIDHGTDAGVYVDFEGDVRPQSAGFDIGYDEASFPSADVGIRKTDGQTTVRQGDALTYTIGVTNAGPSLAAGLMVGDNLPGPLSGGTWTCSAGAGSVCPASGVSPLNALVTVTAGSAVTFTLHATVNISAALGALTNTATLLLPSDLHDPTSADHSASDMTTILRSLYRLFLPLVRR